MTITAVPPVQGAIETPGPWRAYVQWTRKPGLHLLNCKGIFDERDARLYAAAASRQGGVTLVFLHNGRGAYPDAIYRNGVELTGADYEQAFLGTTSSSL